jgi:hypothetical protein
MGLATVVTAFSPARPGADGDARAARSLVAGFTRDGVKVVEAENGDDATRLLSDGADLLVASQHVDNGIVFTRSGRAPASPRCP